MRTCIGNILLQRLSPETSSKKEISTSRLKVLLVSGRVTCRNYVD